MARISIESINESLAQYGWKCVSEKYKNLQTDLEFVCDNGHPVISSWGTMRDHTPICPTCTQGGLCNTKKLQKKDSSIYRVLAVDQATNISGYAIFDNRQLVKHGVFVAREGEEAYRISQVKAWLRSMIESNDIDAVAIEGIQFEQYAGVTTFETLAHLQGVLINFCFESHVPFLVCNTNTWRNDVGVKGSTRADKKKSMQMIAGNLLGNNPSEDEADAIGIGIYASKKLLPQVTVHDWI